ncbi:MAG: beta-lactamase family protein [Proteobacteria bacterium]|nr:beta-lactamase family protein [Pseudomonadota bacterium]MBI3499793.1 beta-lactamase family protein [Pseudomonadota bacterium]
MIAKIDEIFSRWRGDREPGAAVAVIDQGKVVHKACYGLADLEHRQKIAPTSPFYICSITKQFTATLVVMLEAAGKLSLDDEVQKHIPELQRFSERLTLRHLLNNTSGLRDELTLLALSGIPLDAPTSRDQLFDLVTRQKTLDFPPADRFRYCNSNWMLLSIVIERLSGQSFRSYLTDRIFRPLAMQSSRLADDNLELAPDLARPYSPDGGGFRKDVVGIALSGDGGILASLDDLLVWHENYRNNRLLPKDLHQRLATRAVLRTGERIGYAMGLRVLDYRGQRLWMHGGGLPGYKLELCRFPDVDLGIIVMGNREDFRPTFATRAIADLILGERLTPPRRIARPAPAASLAGRYYDRAEGHTLTLSADGDMPLAEVVDYSFGLEQVSADRFETLVGPHPLGFTLAHFDSGRPSRIEATLDGGQRLTFEAAQPVAAPPAKLKDYVGLYAGPDLPFAYRVETSGEGIALRLERLYPRTAANTLSPLFADMFAFGVPYLNKTQMGTIRFQRGPDGKTVSLVVNFGRISNLRLERRKG